VATSIGPAISARFASSREVCVRFPYAKYGRHPLPKRKRRDSGTRFLLDCFVCRSGRLTTKAFDTVLLIGGDFAREG
jgi:hypothetical protein